MAGVRFLFFFFSLVLLSGPILPAPALAQKAGDFDDTAFFSELEDIPLMPGLTELPEESLSFDKPEGRIVEQAALIGHLSRKDILVYYGGVLTHLGWGRVTDTRFFREREYLELSFEEREGAALLKVMVRPAL